MADHYSAAIEHLADVTRYTDDLDEAYATRAGGATIAALHQKIGRELKLAEIHSTLSLRQAVQDAAATVDFAHVVGGRR